MQVNSQKNMTTFKSAVFHNNSKQIITQGNNSLVRKVNKLVKELNKSKDWDLHVLPVGNNNYLAYYWTKKGGQKRCMDTSIGTYFIKDNKLGIYAINPSTYGDLADFSAILTYKNNEEAKKAYDAISSFNIKETTFDEFNRHANATLAIEKAEHFNLNKFLGFNQLLDSLPNSKKFTFPTEPKVALREKNQKSIY